MLRRMQTADDGAPPADTVSFNAAISAMKGGAQWRKALELLAELEAHPTLDADVISYSSAIAACAAGGRWESACKLLHRMRAQGVNPNEYSYGSAISAFTRDIDSFIAKDDFELGRALDGALQAASSEHALHLCPPRASFGWPELEQCPLLRQIELCRCRWCRG